MKKKEKHLTETIGFWLILGIGSLIEIMLLWLILKENDLSFCFTQICIKHFNEIFSIAGVIAAGTITVLAFHATIFKSKQTKRQIELTVEQNTAKNYYDHKKDFKDWLTETLKKTDLQIKSDEYFYKTVYPENEVTYVHYKSNTINNYIAQLKVTYDLWVYPHKMNWRATKPIIRQ